MNDNLQFSGKVALVTAGGAGIGRSIAREWARRGGTVMVTDLREDTANTVGLEIAEFGGTSRTAKLDVRSTADIQSILTATVEAFGGIDVLFNVAGVNLPKTVEETEDEEWALVLEANLTSVYRCSKYVVPEMRKRGGGSIVNVASVAGIIAEKRCAAYSASKGGVVLLTRNMAMDFAKDGIRVNAICPAGTLSPRIQEYLRDRPDLEEEVLAMRPLHRFADPDEIARPAIFLASEEASYITGAALVVDGGLIAGFRVPMFDQM